MYNSENIGSIVDDYENHIITRYEYEQELKLKEKQKPKKKKIRTGCFETDSSSMHSIIVTKNDTHVTPEEFSHELTSPDPYPDEYIYMYNGKWHLDNVEYGYGRKPFQFLTTFEDKFKYALCEFCGYYHGDEDEFYEKFSELEDLARKIIPNCDGLRLNVKEVDIYLDKNGNEVKYKDLHYDHYNGDENRPEYYYIDENGEKQIAIFDEENFLEVPAIGVIDHQSSGLLTGFLKSKGISLEEFLTNKKYVIVIDGDEYCTFEKYMKSGLIDKNFIIWSSNGGFM